MLKKILTIIMLTILSVFCLGDIKTEVYPAQDMKVNKDTSIYIRFSKDMNAEFINRFTFILNDGSSDIKGKVLYNEDEKTAYFVPRNFLRAGTNYKAMLYKGVKAIDQDVISDNIIWSFRVIQDNIVVSTFDNMYENIKAGDSPKKEYLKVLKTIPDDKSVINETNPITVKFSAPIDEKTVNKYTFMVKSDKRTIEGKFEIRDNSVIFLPFQPFDLDSQYTVVLTNFITDNSGKSLQETYEFHFRTSKERKDEFPKVVESYPGDREYNISPDTSIIVKFNKSMDTESLNRFNITLNDGEKNVWGNIKYNEKEKVLEFKPENELPINRKCTFRLRENLRDTQGKYMTAPFEAVFSTGSEKIIVLNDKKDKYTEEKKQESIEDEIYTERYKLNTSDMFFIKEIFPKDRENEIKIDTKIMLGFSKETRAETVNEFTFSISDGVKNVWGDVIYDAKNFTAWFSPKEELRHNTIYYIRVSDSIKDIHGNNLDRFYEWSFITERLPDRTAPRVSEVFPLDKEIEVKEDVIIKVQFSEAIRSESLNQFTVRLADNDEYIKTDISYDKETNIAFIAPIDNLKEHHLYKMIIGQAISDIAGNFMAEPIEWTFWVGTPPDNVSPVLLGISPRENAPVYTTKPIIAVTFNEELDTKTITPFNFGLFDGDRPVKGIVKYNNITHRIYYEYHEELIYGKTYTVTLTNRIRDISGNYFGKNIAWEFIISHNEKTLPFINATFPFEGRNNFSCTENVVAQFNKDMNPISLNRFTVKLRDINTYSIPGEIVYNSTSREMIFRPYHKLEFNTRYTLHINRYVQDTEGKNMKENFVLTFYTEGRGHNDEID
ncbi:MAG: Ig-like domain-containing protein [Candidatus Muirbacterium halophilum]|nr:Ig-like domain-containing protein [Candidatus Muirbacterium halophilum]